MQAVGSIVLRQRILLAIEGEAPVGDTVRVPSDVRAEIRYSRKVGIQRVETKHDVREMAGAVRCLQRHDGGSKGHDSGFDAMNIGQCVNFHGLLSGAAE